MSETTIALIKDYGLLLPIFGLIWKLSALVNDHKKLKEDFKKAYDLFCKKNAAFEQKLEDEKNSTDSVTNTIINELHKLGLAIARIETKLEDK